MMNRIGIILLLAVLGLGTWMGVLWQHHSASARTRIQQDTDSRKYRSLQAQVTEFQRILANPGSGKDSDFLTLLDQKLSAAELSPAIKEIEPLEAVAAGQFTMEEMRIRMSPVSPGQLDRLLAVLETERPCFRITAWEFIRVHPGDTDLNVFLTLQRWTRI